MVLFSLRVDISQLFQVLVLDRIVFYDFDSVEVDRVVVSAEFLTLKEVDSCLVQLKDYDFIQ